MRIETLNTCGVLGSEVFTCPLGGAEYDGKDVLSCRHLIGFGCSIDDLIISNQREVPGHELYNRSHSNHCCTDSKASKPASEIGVSTTRVGPN